MSSLVARVCVCVVLALAGCGAPERAQILPPQVSIAAMRIVGANLLEQEFELTLRLTDPNTFDLDVDGMRFRLRLNERDFLEGQSNRAVRVPRLGEAQTTARGRTTLLDVMQQTMALADATEFRYALEGVVFAAGAPPSGLSFTKRGELNLASPRDQRFKPLR
ncbi:MAG: hypothetical protein EXQ88_07635 [Alphaproteobacteria bacterium]|nr:hypothetical protein [Alphaproteobacteria bacterium]